MFMQVLTGLRLRPPLEWSRPLLLILILLLIFSGTATLRNPGNRYAP